MTLTTRTRTFVLLVAIVLASLLTGCIDLDDNTNTVYANPTQVHNPYGEQIKLHEQVEQAPNTRR